jgi:hypothetical protein
MGIEPTRENESRHPKMNPDTQNESRHPENKMNPDTQKMNPDTQKKRTPISDTHNLEDADFRHPQSGGGADFRDADFRDADFRHPQSGGGADFSGTEMNPDTQKTK